MMTESIIKYLKSKAPTYPDYLEEKINYVLYYSTIVRIKRENKWHRVHCIRSVMLGKNSFFPTNPKEDKKMAFDLFHSEVYKIIHCYKPNGIHEELDNDQESEIKRLMKLEI